MEIFLTDLLRPETIIEYGGIGLLLFIIFAETGLFFGFFLPGDSLLFVAGLLCGSPYLPFPLWLLITTVVAAAFGGTTVGYGFGFWAKGYLHQRKENFFYRKSYIEITKRFYQKYGMMAFIVGRFLPLVRTFVPILAGIVRIDFKKFLFYNLLGAVCWVIPMISSGYLLGKSFPGITDHLDLIVLLMILLSGIPFLVFWKRNRSVVR
ncbi:MAG: VTT domain-containing protein [Flammeovirgaceae bacterium]|nr:MAG: VTT domain-containing protein [Flammeovirgaceae bacterium]